MRKKPDWQDRVERTLKDSLKVQREILATAKLILAAIETCHESAITIHPGLPRFASKASLPHRRHIHLDHNGH